LDEGKILLALFLGVLIGVGIGTWLKSTQTVSVKELKKAGVYP